MCRRLSILLACAATLFFSACGDSKLPQPTGKGAIRGINAVPASPGVIFRIEERALGSINYKDATDTPAYDDFSYNFNFDVLFAGDDEPTRIATQELKVERDREYTFVLSGTLANPVVTVWEAAVERIWEGSETVFELKFGHAAASYGDVDIYLVPQGETAGPGNLAASLAFGAVSATADVADGPYTIVITTSGDINDVLYASNEITFFPRVSLLISIFDGDENDLGPLAVRGILTDGSLATYPDAGTSPSVRFVHASIDLGNVDVYDDDTLTSRILANQAFGEFSGDVPVAAGLTTFTYTPPDDTGVVLIEQEIPIQGGQRLNFYAIGQSGAHAAIPVVDDRRSVSVEARFRLFHASFNHTFVDVYVVEDGTAIDETIFPVRGGLTFSSGTRTLSFQEGEWDVYVTALGDRDTVLAGPFDLSLALGDVVTTVLLDTVDTATAEIRVIPAP